MAQAAVQPESANFVEASLSYLVDTGVKPSSYSAGPGGLLRARTGEYADHVMKIHDGRPLKDDFTMDGEGFKFVDHPTKMVDFYDEEELRRVYYPEIEELVKLHTGGKRVFIFDHTVRNGDDKTREARKVREPVRTVHNDYTEWSAPQRVRDMLPADEVDDLLSRRFLVVQVWRSIAGPIESAPLAICDAKSAAFADMIATERKSAERVGETYNLTYNPDHKWYYFPKMARDEALVFKVYDSEKDGRARFTAHTSFENPDAPADAAPRESIEMRTFVFY